MDTADTGGTQRQPVEAPRSGRRGRLLVVACAIMLAALVVGFMAWPITPEAASGSRPADANVIPQVLAVHPSVLPGKGGVRILVLGRGFVPGLRITVGGRPAVVRSVRSAGAAVAIVPPGIGTEVVRAMTPAGTSAVAPHAVVRFDTRLLIVGDSLGIDLGWGLPAPLGAREHVAVVDDAVGSSGLVRADYFNWPGHLRFDLAATHADVVVALFGTNDQQAIRTRSGFIEPGTAGWARVYAARVRQIAEIVHRAGAVLLWVGLPRMGPHSVVGARFVERLRALDRSVVAHLPDATFVDAWLLFTARDGTYAPYVEVSGRGRAPGHEPDGTHLTPAGASAIDARAIDALRALLMRG